MTGATACQTVFQATPSISARAETAMSWERSCVTAQAIARVVSLARGAASSWTSLNVTTSQASSRHLKIRLRHTTRTGTPAQGRSWSTTSRRP